MAKTKKSAKKKAGDKEVKIDRRRSERRKGDDARVASTPVSEERRSAPRRKIQRRRQIDPTTCERDYNAEEIEFMRALDAYKRSSGRMFPTCSEILEVIRSLGYERPSVDVDSTVDELSSNVEQPVVAGNLETGSAGVDYDASYDAVGDLTEA